MYRNQAIFHQNVSVLLSSLIGSTDDGNHKIGNARFHLLYSFRDGEDQLKTGGTNFLLLFSFNMLIFSLLNVLV